MKELDQLKASAETNASRGRIRITIDVSAECVVVRVKDIAVPGTDSVTDVYGKGEDSDLVGALNDAYSKVEHIAGLREGGGRDS